VEVEVGGLRIAYERRGSGPPLVLLHGGLGDRRDWEPQLDGLSDELTVVAWDAPGCGGSDDPPPTFRFPDYADVLAGFIEALGLGRPHALGLSWGSTLALELYRRRPDMPRTLILAAGYAGWAGSLQPEVVRRRVTDTLAELDTFAPQEYARTWIPTLFTERAPAELVERSLRVMAEFRPAGVRPMLHAMAEADLREVLPTIGVPTLLIHGELDVRSPVTVAREMHASIPRSSLAMLPNVGHMCNLETPDAFNAVVREFLTRAG
jgi:pimeloyl-ACP methyl ester carboxylesterase